MGLASPAMTRAPAPRAASFDAPAWTMFSSSQRWGMLAVLFLISTSNYLDRSIISVLLEPIKMEFGVSDAMLGLLSGFCFALFYAVAGIPVARWADRGNRRTIITLALTVWSIMTALCGMAQTFWQLALARVGVGAGESGAIPPAQSLIADYFPPERRATAIGIFTASSTAGSLLGLGLGGYIAATYGWRDAFLVVAVPGLLLAVLARLSLVEPRLRRPSLTRDAIPESLGRTLVTLSRKRSFVCALIGCWLYYFAGYGALVFAPSFLIRVLHASVAEAGTSYGGVVAAASLIGALGGGWLADRLGRVDVRWLAWLPALACVLAGPLYMLAFTARTTQIFLILAFVGYLIFVGGLSPVFAAIHAICGNARRAMAIAIVLFSATLIGGGFGPLATGALSDFLSGRYGADGLRYALITMMALPVASGVAFHYFALAMPRDLEN